MNIVQDYTMTPSPMNKLGMIKYDKVDIIPQTLQISAIPTKRISRKTKRNKLDWNSHHQMPFKQKKAIPISKAQSPFNNEQPID